MTLFIKAVIIKKKNFFFFSFEQMDNPEPTLGLLVTTVEGTEKRLSLGQVMWSQKPPWGWWQGPVQHFHHSVTEEECAVNVEILPETFQTDSEEQRKIVIVFQLWSSMESWRLG